MKAPGAGARPARAGLFPAALAFALVWAPPAGAQTGTAAPARPAAGQPAPAAETSVRALEARIESLERRLGASALFDLVARVDRLAKDIQVLRDRADLDARALERLRTRQQDLYAEIDRLAQRIAQPVEEAVAGGRPEGAEAPEPGDGTGTVRQHLDRLLAAMSAEAPEPGDGTGTGATAADAASPGPRAPGDAGDGGGAAPEREPAGAAGSGGEGSGADPKPGGEPAMAMDPLEEQERYRLAFDLLSEGRFENAATAFSEFLDAFPQSRYRDNARFWMGDCLYALRRFEPALSEFRKLIEDHPDSSRIPGARLKIGFILHELGRTGEAVEELRALVDSAPDTSEAKLARDRLERLR